MSQYLLKKCLHLQKVILVFFDMLKREDEIYVVKTAFDSAAFCEDICREISKESFTRFRGKGGTIKVKVVTDESIHPHRAFAKKEILL